MEVTIEQSCPSCGAAITIGEDDRLIQCGYCNVHNYKIGSIGSRYVLPVLPNEQHDKEQLIYVPYLRFKGSVLYVRGQEVKQKIVDTTRIGLDSDLFPVSLGLRPQAMKIKPVASSTNGIFILQSVPTKTVFTHASMVIDIFKAKSSENTYHRAFIGETLSRIYLPCYLKGDNLHDAVNNLKIGHRSMLEGLLNKTCCSKASWEPHFISTICPGCGGLLSGERDCLVLQCQNCRLLWQESKQKFTPIEWQVVASEDPRARYLPFWKIRVQTKRPELQSFGDFLRFTNQPVVVRKQCDAIPLTFWIPAFKIQPKTFLQVASRMTVGQERITGGETRRVANDFPVTLNQTEAIQAIKSVLACSTLSREKKFPLLPELQISDVRSSLTYLPFTSQSHDLVQEHTQTTIRTAAIRHGRSL